jgi:hypothetical protein
VSKTLHGLLSLFLALCIGLGPLSPAMAQSAPANDLCRAQGTALVFFNGVLTTPDGADAALAELRRLHGTTSPAGDAIRYEKLYNYTSGFEDFVETFEQRLSEQENLLEGRYELFFEALNGEGPWWSRIISSVAEAAGILDGIVDWFKAATIRNLTTLLGNPPTTVNYLEHRARLENLILEGRKLLLVAHSQGNLFVNAAYDYATTKVDASSVKVVHIAPASPTLRGTHILADLDLVINGLRLVGTVPDITDAIPGALLRAAGANGKKDPLGHGLLEIYINQALGISAHVRNAINSALTELVAPPVVAATGLFSATLTWDGDGDVDLHTYEPSGSHVYYSNMTGVSGYLDVDNTQSYGPEHYYASCSSSALLPGNYQIAVANYSGADNRTATVQIASWADGVLGTRSVTLGARTRDTPSATLFTVVVTKNPDTGRYSISLAP